jgi:hypothetical protein
VTAACRLTATTCALKPFGAMCFREVLEEVETDGLDARGRLRDGALGRVLLLDGRALLVGAVGEDAVEELVERVAEHAQLGQPALVEDRHRRAVLHGLLDRVLVDVPAEGLKRAACPSCRSACP